MLSSEQRTVIGSIVQLLVLDVPIRYQMYQMYRISKQLEVSRLIQECDAVEELCEWSKVIVNQIHIQNHSKNIFNIQIKIW